MSLSGRAAPSRRAFLAATAAFALPGRAHAETAGNRLTQAVARGTLRCAVLAALVPPTPSDPRPAAFQLDAFTQAIAELIAAGIDLQPEILPSPAGGVLGDVISGRADIGLMPLVVPWTLRQTMFATPITTVDVPVLGIGPRRRNWLQMGGRRLGATPPYAGALMELGLPLDSVEVIPVNGLLQLEAMLRAREIDDVMVNRWHLRNLRERNPDLALTQHFVAMTRPHGIAIAHGQHDLLRTVNTVLALARHSGRLAQLHRQHFGLPLPDLELL